MPLPVLASLSAVSPLGAESSGPSAAELEARAPTGRGPLGRRTLPCSSWPAPARPTPPPSRPGDMCMSSTLDRASGGGGGSSPLWWMMLDSARHSPQSSMITAPPPRLACLQRGGSRERAGEEGALLGGRKLGHQTSPAMLHSPRSCPSLPASHVCVRLTSPIATSGRSVCTPHLAWSRVVWYGRPSGRRTCWGGRAVGGRRKAGGREAGTGALHRGGACGAGRAALAVERLAHKLTHLQDVLAVRGRAKGRRVTVEPALHLPAALKGGRLGQRILIELAIIGPPLHPRLSPLGIFCQMPNAVRQRHQRGRHRVEGPLEVVAERVAREAHVRLLVGGDAPRVHARVHEPDLVCSKLAGHGARRFSWAERLAHATRTHTPHAPGWL